VAKRLAGGASRPRQQRGVEPARTDARRRATRVVHLGTDYRKRRRSRQPLIPPVAHLVAPQTSSEVYASAAEIPQVRYLIVGDGPERGAPLERARNRASAISERVELAGQLPHEHALAGHATA